MVRLAFAAACCVLAVGTAAQAQTTFVTGNAQSFINNNDPVGGVGVYQSNFGAANYASTISITPTAVNPDKVTFESGNALTGGSMDAFSSTNVNLSLVNGGNAVVTPTLHSQITAAGMGFYMADTRTCGTNPQSCAQSQGLATLRDLVAPVGAAGSGTLGGASFDFTIVANDQTLFSVHGSMSLNFNADGVFVDTNIEDAQGKLAGFTTLQLGNAGSALGFAWDATNVPDLLLNAIDPDSTEHVNYQVSVSSFTRGACLADGFTCLVAYSAFGDPIGRGGDITNDFRTGGNNFLGAFGGGFGQNAGTSFINGVTFGETTVTAPTVTFAGGVPEPATWMSMIAGFGLLGAALRRRRVLAYT
jgi:hypothetical protein